MHQGTMHQTLLARPSAFWQHPGESRNPFASSYQRWPAHWSNSCSQAYHVTTAHAKQHEHHTGLLHDLRALRPPGIGCKNTSKLHVYLTQQKQHSCLFPCALSACACIFGVQVSNLSQQITPCCSRLLPCCMSQVLVGHPSIITLQHTAVPQLGFAIVRCNGSLHATPALCMSCTA